MNFDRVEKSMLDDLLHDAIVNEDDDVEQAVTIRSTRGRSVKVKAEVSHHPFPTQEMFRTV